MIRSAAIVLPVVVLVGGAGVFALHNALVLGPVVFLLGLVYSLVLAVRGRLETGPHTQRVMGLWQWSSRQALVSAK